jgi:hypothetical protein
LEGIDRGVPIDEVRACENALTYTARRRNTGKAFMGLAHLKL